MRADWLDFIQRMIDAWTDTHGLSKPSIFSTTLWRQLDQMAHSAPDVHAQFLRLDDSEKAIALSQVRLAYSVMMVRSGGFA